MAVYKETGRNTFRADIFLNSKKIATRTGFRNATLARKWHDEHRVLLSNNFNSCLPSNKLKFRDIVEKFIKDYVETSVKESSKVRYLIDINYRLLPEFGYLRVNKIYYGIIKNFQNKLYREGRLKAASINRCMTVLHSIFERAIEFGLCAANPCRNLKQLKEVKKPYRWWRNYEDGLLFLESLKGHHYYMAYRVALETGMRLGELIGLTWDAIDINTGAITVSQQYCSKQKKLLPLKNNQYRNISLPTSTLTLIQEAKRTSTSNFVFTELDSSIIQSYSISGNFFSNQQKKAGIPIINFHGLRHTYASHFMMNGGNIYKLSKLLGHADIKTTMIYSHVSPESLEEDRNRVSFDTSNIIMLKKSISA